MPRKIAVINGSDSDLDQCERGLQALQAADNLGIFTASIHRNTKDVLVLVERLVKEGVDVIIVGAGWANHLTGTIDAYLRYTLKNNHVVIVGVAFRDKNNVMNTQAAILSIERVPKTNVVFDNYVGPEGFTAACEFAVEGKLPKITIGTPKPTESRSLVEAIKEAQNKIKEKEKKKDA